MNGTTGRAACRGRPARPSPLRATVLPGHSLARDRRTELPKRSAGILLYRVGQDAVEVLLVHPGGPFWANRDLGAWSIPKGESQQGEDPLTAALREFEEETGNTFTMEWPPRSGKRREFPEVDRAGWFDPDAAREKLVAAQAELVDRLLATLAEQERGR